MEISNPKIPEGINSEDESPLKELALLAVIIAAATALVIWLCVLLADWLAPHVPFSWEQKLRYVPENAVTTSAADITVQRDLAKLRRIGAAIAGKMDLPAEISVEFHLTEDGKLSSNAFATLGGQIFFGRKLLAAMPNENALGFVLAHEIAHVRERHVARAAGRNLLFTLVSVIVFGHNGTLDRFIGLGNLLSTFQYSRTLEDAADLAAIKAIYRQYGHAGGFEDAFQLLAKFSKNRTQLPEILKTHPDLTARIFRLKVIAKELGFPITEARIPLTNSH